MKLDEKELKELQDVSILVYFQPNFQKLPRTYFYLFIFLCLINLIEKCKRKSKAKRRSQSRNGSNKIRVRSYFGGYS